MGRETRMLFLFALIAIGLLLSSASYRPPEVKATFSAVNVNLTATISGNVTPPGPTDEGTGAKGGAGGAGGLPPAPAENVTNETNMTEVTPSPEEKPAEEGVPSEKPGAENITGGVQRPMAAPDIAVPVIGGSAVVTSLIGYMAFAMWNRSKRKKETLKKAKGKKGLNR